MGGGDLGVHLLVGAAAVRGSSGSLELVAELKSESFVIHIMLGKN